MNGFTRIFDKMDNVRLEGDGLLKRDVRDTKGEVMATLVAATTDDMYMNSVSIVDHLTEPCDVKEYDVAEDGGLWWLRRTVPGLSPFYLGSVSTEVEANVLLTHVKEAADENGGNWHDAIKRARS